MADRGWKTLPHPRLFFGREDIDPLRAKRKADPIAGAAWERVQREVRKAEAMELPAWSDRWEWDTGSDGQKNLGTVAGECARAVWNLGFSWLLDGVASHARKATDVLMALCDFDFWTSPRFFGTDYRLPWRGTLETAGICHLAACGYDWLHDFMTEPERHRLRTCLLYKGILPLVQDWADPLTRLPLSTHMLPWGNWWQNCIAPAGEASMALFGEHPLAERFARLCREASDWFFRFEGASVPEMSKELLVGDMPGVSYPPNFDSDGGYWEGLCYVDWVLVNSFHFAEAYRRRTGEDIIPKGLAEKVAGLILDGSFRMGDRMRTVDFGDSRAGWATSMLVTGYLARRLRHPGLQWYLCNSQKNLGEPFHFRLNESPVFTFLWYDPSLAPEEPKPVSPLKVYRGMGMAVLRSGWGHQDSMLALKCGATAGHAHADAGSFVLYSHDEQLLIDSGICGYEMPEQNAYYHTTRAHNTVLVGGKGQVKRLEGKILQETGVPGMAFVLADAAPPYEGRLERFLRGVLFVAGRYYVVADWLAGKGDRSFQWLLHYDGGMTPEDGGYLIRNGKAGVLVAMIEPVERRFAVRQGYKTYNEDLGIVKSTEEKQKELEPGDYLEITPRARARRQSFLTVLCPFGDGQPPVGIRPSRSGGWTGAWIDRDSERDLIGLRWAGKRSGPGFEGVDTDAAMFCVTTDLRGRPLRAFIHDGTHLSLGGRKLTASGRPRTLAFALRVK